MQGDIEYIDIYQCLISVKQGDIEYNNEINDLQAQFKQCKVT